MSLAELIDKKSREYEIFSNPLRTLILLFVLSKEEVAWSDLKNFLEEHIGKLNPNTLSFHLSKLLEAGYLIKVELEAQPRYKIAEDRQSEIEGMLGKELVEKIREQG